MENNDIHEKLSQIHLGDTKQLEVIFSNEKRLLVEAPAGYGKTKTIISKIAYLLVTNQIPYPKRILVLTFSVNAAFKIKKDVLQKIPEIISSTEYRYGISDKIIVSNYHGFARRILKKYGYKIHPNLMEIDRLQTTDDSDTKKLMQLNANIDYDDAFFMGEFNEDVKKCNFDSINKKFAKYNKIVITKFIELNIIPYNAILTLTYSLLKDNSEICSFYQKFFSVIIVDEYQDTNILSILLLQHLFTDYTKLIILGDSLQRIYGFIGAIPDLLLQSEKKFNLKRITLDKNYRFSNNTEMLLLDNNIRRNAENPFEPDTKVDAKINFFNFTNQEDEANFLINKSVDLLKKFPDSNIAILVKQRGYNVNLIIEKFNEYPMPFFYGLFSDEDPLYVKFHKDCLYEFIKLIKNNLLISKKVVQNLINTIKLKYSSSEPINSSMIKLLKVFSKKIFSDFAFLSNEDKINLISDTFAHNGLKQYVEFIDTKITISTIHGSKGLEWDFVLLPDMEAYSFPNYFGLCSICQSNSTCNLKITTANEAKYLEELSVFYVAVTRARKQIYFSASQYQLNTSNEYVKRNISCFLKLPGIMIY